jgi:hypothetical protein
MIVNKFVLFTSLFTALRRNDFISVSPQITYGNKTLMLFSYFPGEKKKRNAHMYADYWEK